MGLRPAPHHTYLHITRTLWVVSAFEGSVWCAPGLVNLAAAASGEAEDEEEEQD
eukprot:COSAG01_NODE_61626_length_288_cov_1.497354_1_plen_53_part_10